MTTKFAHYSNRNKRLLELGHESYQAYLESDEWKAIRAKVLKRDRHKCVLCGKHATQVHHRSYHVKALIGAKTLSLVSICRTCHESIEFSNGSKTELKEANRRMVELCKANGTTPPNKCSVCKVNYVRSKRRDRTCRACKRAARD